MAFLTKTGSTAKERARKLDDAAVLERSFTDPRAFEVLVDRYQDGFLRSAQKIVHSRQDAEDIVQEAFVKIYFNGKKFKKQKGATFSSWAYKVLLNTAYSRYRKLKKKEVPLEEFFDSVFYERATQEHKAHLASLNTKETVEATLAEMPTDMADLLRLHYFEGYSYRDISFSTGLTTSALKTRLYRARKLFKDYFLKVSETTL